MIVMQITVNDETMECPDGASISDLLVKLDIDIRYVAVEKNREIVPRTLFEETILHESDTLEIVTFVGGG